MNIAAFLLALVLQVVLTLWLTSIYFGVARRVRDKRGIGYRAGEFTLFLLFALTVIPTCLYFPAWLGEQLAALAPTQASTMGLLALGGVGLVVSIVGGWQRAHKK